MCPIHSYYKKIHIWIFLITVLLRFGYTTRVSQKDFFIIRGLPGAGKNTLIAALIPHEKHVYGADDFLLNRKGEYEWSKEAHMTAISKCRTAIETALRAGEPRVLLHSVLDERSHVDEYVALGTKYGYRIFSIIVENRHGGLSTHHVPPETMEKFRSHFDIQL